MEGAAAVVDRVAADGPRAAAEEAEAEGGGSEREGEREIGGGALKEFGQETTKKRFFNNPPSFHSNAPAASITKPVDPKMTRAAGLYPPGAVSSCNASADSTMSPGPPPSPADTPAALTTTSASGHTQGLAASYATTTLDSSGGAVKSLLRSMHVPSPVAVEAPRTTQVPGLG